MVEDREELCQRKPHKTDTDKPKPHRNNERYESDGKGTDDHAQRIRPKKVVGDQGCCPDLCSERHEIRQHKPFNRRVSKLCQHREVFFGGFLSVSPEVLQRFLHLRNEIDDSSDGNKRELETDIPQLMRVQEEQHECSERQQVKYIGISVEERGG